MSFLGDVLQTSTNVRQQTRVAVNSNVLIMKVDITALVMLATDLWVTTSAAKVNSNYEKETDLKEYSSYFYSKLLITSICDIHDVI